MTKEQLKELLRSQQGELNAVLMYQALAKVVKIEKERETFLQLAKRREACQRVSCLHEGGLETQEDHGSHHASAVLFVRQEASL